MRSRLSIVAVEAIRLQRYPQLVLDDLPEQYRATCRGCGKPMPLTRSNVKYHDNACKQAASVAGTLRSG